MKDDHIEFDTDQQGFPASPSASPSQFASQTFGQTEASGMAGWLMRKGIIHNETQAKTLLVGVVFFNFIVAGLVFYFFVFK